MLAILDNLPTLEEGTPDQGADHADSEQLTGEAALPLPPIDALLAAATSMPACPRLPGARAASRPEWGTY